MSVSTRNPNAGTTGVGAVIITPLLIAGETSTVNYLYAVVDLPTPSMDGDYYSFWSSWNSSTNTLTYFYSYNSKYGGYTGNLNSATLKTYMLPPFLDLPSTLPPTITINVTGIIPTAIGSGTIPISVNLSTLVPTPPPPQPVKSGQVNTQVITSDPVRPPHHEPMEKNTNNNLSDDAVTPPLAYALREYFVQSVTNTSQYFIIFLAGLGAEGYTRMLDLIPVNNSAGAPNPAVIATTFPNSNMPNASMVTATGYLESTNGQYLGALTYNGNNNGWQPLTFATSGANPGSCFANPQQL